VTSLTSRKTDFLDHVMGQGTVQTVTVHGRPGWLSLDMWGTLTTITWNVDPSTSESVRVNDFQPTAWTGRASQSSRPRVSPMRSF
jgi:hypothetical protein